MTRRQLAMAFCASVRTWVPICTGPTNNVTRNAKASTRPGVMSEVKPSRMPMTMTPGVGEAGRETAQRERRDGVGLGVGVGPLPVDDRVVDAGLGAVLDAVRAHDGGTHDRLGDRAEQDPHLVADDGVGRGELLLEPADREEQRGEGQPDHRGELPAVEQHQDRRDQHLADAHDEDQSAEDEELADLVDVGGHPRHQGAATLGVLRQQRQVVDVAERLGAERGEAALGRGEEPLRHEVGREAGDQDREGRCHTHPDDESDPWPIGAVEAAVEGLLDGDGHHDLAAGGDDRQDQGPAQPLAQLGRVLHAEPDGLHGGDVLAGVHPGARQGLRRGAHGALRRSSGWRRRREPPTS